MKKYFEILNLINRIIKNINWSMGIQVMVIVVEFFVFALLFIFCSAIMDSFETEFVRWKIIFFSGSFYTHLIIFQISYFASATKVQVSILN